jgi:hypothetical protein
LKWKGMYNIDDGRVWGFDDFDIYATDARSWRNVVNHS